MSVSTKDYSIESMLNSIFSNEEENTTEIDISIVDEEILKDLSPDEAEIIDSPIEEEEGADEEAIAEESAKRFGEISMLNLAFQTAEEYIWDSKIHSIEADETAGDDEKTTKKEGILKKIFDWLKSILIKIKEFLLTLFKRLQIWLSGSLKNLSKWAYQNQEVISRAIKKHGQITLKTKKPVYHPSKGEIFQDAIKSIDYGNFCLQMGAQVSEYEEAIEKLNKVSKLTTKDVDKEIFGDKTEVKDVTLKEFDSVIPIIDTLTTAVMIKSYVKNLGEAIKKTTKLISIINTNYLVKKILGDNSRDTAYIRKMCSSIQKASSTSSTILYHRTLVMINLVKVAKRFADAALKADKEKVGTAGPEVNTLVPVK